MLNLDEILIAEQQLLGCCILDPSVVDIAAKDFTEGDFVGPGHGKAFGIICDLKAAGGDCSDVRELVRLFRRAGIESDLGGVHGVAAWCDVSLGSLQVYMRNVRRSAQYRRLDSLLSQTRMRLDQSDDPAAVAKWLTASVDQIAGERGFAFQMLGEAADEALDRIMEARQRGRSTGRSTGITELDGVIGGLFESDMIVIAARPSVGKTALATQLAMHDGSNEGSVLFLSLEMQGYEVALRQMAKMSRIATSELRAATVSDDDVDTLRGVTQELHSCNVCMLHSRRCTVEKISAAARLKKATTGLSMVVVDYLGKLTTTDTRKPRWEWIADASSALKDLAIELKVPVVVLSQLSRAADKEKPSLAHLRDSGAVEQDADVVMLLHRESKGSPDATIDIAKNRQGATGPIELKFDPHTTTFYGREAKDMENYEPAFSDYDTPF